MAGVTYDIYLPVVIAVVLVIVYPIYLAVTRLYFSPISHIPGPKLVAISGWPEFYYDYFKGGKYIFEIKKMHERYGPIVRINPEEISISDPDFYNEIYVTGSKRRTNSYETFCKGIDFEGSHFLTADHGLHRMRRKPLEPFFSRAGVQRLHTILGAITLKLEERLKSLTGTEKVVRLDHVFNAFSGDVISQICLGSSSNTAGFLDDPKFSPGWYDAIHAIVRSLPLFTAFPILVRIVSLVPENVLLWAYPRGKTFKGFSDTVKQRIHQALYEKRVTMSEDSQRSLFHHIAASDMFESERFEERLVKEAQVLLGAGTASTARTIGFASYYILSRADLRCALRNELAEIMKEWPNSVPTWPQLEQLPLLQAIIKESLRLSYGVMHRLPRISPDEAIRYQEYLIPEGVPIGMSAYLQHSNPSVYPNPDRFLPERWVGDIDPRMQKSYVPFCRGSRNCLGMNLAMAEMSLVLAVLFRPGAPNLVLFETDESDVRHVHDFVIPLPKLTTRGVRAKIL